MVAHSRSVVVISCTMGISAGTTLSSALGRGAGSPGAPRRRTGPHAGWADGGPLPAPLPGTYPLRSTTAPFRWMSEAGKMPWGSQSCQRLRDTALPGGHGRGHPCHRGSRRGPQPGACPQRGWGEPLAVPWPQQPLTYPGSPVPERVPAVPACGGREGDAISQTRGPSTPRQGGAGRPSAARAGAGGAEPRQEGAGGHQPPLPSEACRMCTVSPICSGR